MAVRCVNAVNRHSLIQNTVKKLKKIKTSGSIVYKNRLWAIT